MEQAQYEKVVELRKVADNWLANHNQYKIGAQNAEMQKKSEYMQQVADQCAKLIKEHNRLENQGGYVIYFVGADDKESENTRKAVAEIGKAYAGKLTVKYAPSQNPETLRKGFGVEILPTVFFMNAGKAVAKHEGQITQSMLSKKADMLISGADFSNSKSVATIQNQKTVSKKEIIALGEFSILFYDAVWCGVSKMMRPIVEAEALQFGNKIKLEKFDVNYRPKIAQKFNVQQIPTTIFLHKGQEVGRLVGYFDDKQVHKIVEQFVDNESAPTLTSDKYNPLTDPNAKKEGGK